jgi:hypothetical protein
MTGLGGPISTLVIVAAPVVVRALTRPLPGRTWVSAGSAADCPFSSACRLERDQGTDVDRAYALERDVVARGSAGNRRVAHRGRDAVADRVEIPAPVRERPALRQLLPAIVQAGEQATRRRAGA